MRDRRLVHRLRRGDVDALQQIYHRYKDELLTVAMSLLGDVHGAEDCVHDVFVHFAEAPEDLRANTSLRGYLVRCVANRAKDVLKNRRRTPELPTDEPQSSDGPVQGSIAAEESQRVFHALAQLPAEQREVITLHLQGQMRFREIAEHLELSINTVQSRYQRLGTATIDGVEAEGFEVKDLKPLGNIVPRSLIDLQQGTATLWVGTKDLLPIRMEGDMRLGKTMATLFMDVHCHETAVLEKYNVELDPGLFDLRTPEGYTEFNLMDLFPGMFRLAGLGILPAGATGWRRFRVKNNQTIPAIL